MRFPHFISRHQSISRHIFAIFLLIFTGQSVFAGNISVAVSGQFSEIDQIYSGTAVYRIQQSSGNSLLFHLPPRWRAEEDPRTAYSLRLTQKGTTAVPRKELSAILPPEHDNIHQAKDIQIEGVSVDGRDVKYRIQDNPDLPPSLNSAGALLEISLDNAHEGLSTVSITFTTWFHSLPDGYRRFLWDFIPRPVGRTSEGLDLRGSVPPNMRQNVVIRRTDTRPDAGSEITANFTAPVAGIMLDEWDYQDDNLLVSFDSRFEDSRLQLISRIIHVSEFLQNNSVFAHRKEKLRLIIWDGPLKVSGLTVLLPRKLFRYPLIFYKQHEITILNSIVKALLLRRFSIDASLDPWIIAAFQSEIVRYYFNRRFKGNTFLFPWLDWINPEYFSDTTVGPWVENLNEKEISAADLPADISYFAHIHHPGSQKGAHLLWILHDGSANYRKRLIQRVFFLLNEPAAIEREYLSPNRFFELFTASDNLRMSGHKWLSVEGRVDYTLENVRVKREADGYAVRFQVRNLGTLSPRLELGIYFEGDNQQKYEIEGPGEYVFFVAQEPQQIILDPAFNILDDNPVNNRWRFPVRTRPIWDFAPPDIWLFTMSPLVGEANTFDRNILGLNMMASYMSRTIFQLNIWKGSGSELLWTGEFQHLGFPYTGTQLYLKTGYLGAANSTSTGFKHSLFKGFPGLWIDAAIWKERLDDMEDDEFSEEELDWTGLILALEFPLFQHALHNWQVNLLGRTGYSMFSPHAEYQQLKVVQNLRYSFGTSDIHLGYQQGYSSGIVPLQHRYPMGGTEGLAGFPRDTDLLFNENRILEIGTTLPPFLTHTDINLLGLMWLNRVVPTLDFHYGQGISANSEIEEFQDVELSLSIEGEFINRFYGKGRFGVAQPIGHKKYKDYRVVLFSDWVF